VAEGPQEGRQLPRGEEIFLDHVGHFVRDPQAASRVLTRAGFAPTPVSVQTQPDAAGAPRLTGTAMLTRGYVEVLFKTADTPLGGELDAAMKRHVGVHLVAFAVADAAGAHQLLRESGFRTRPLVDMQRPVDTEGKPGTAAFTVARLEPGEMPEGRIQLLTHHTEHMVWQPRWLSHPNGALGLASVTIAVGDVNEAGQRFGRLAGRQAEVFPSGRRIDLDRGRVDLVAAGAFSEMFPQVPIPSLPFIGAYGIEVRSLEAAERILMPGGIATERRGKNLVAAFPEELGRGAWVFSCASDDPR
jgi:hypothetical protein